MNLRIKNLYVKLENENIDGLIVSSPPNISYLTKFISRDSYFLVSKKGNIYFTDSRYTEEAKRGIKKVARVKKSNGSIFKLIVDACRNFRLKRVGFEERALVYAEYKKIKEGFSKIIDFIPTHNLVEDLRQIKSAEELEKIKKAIRITIKALKFIKDFITPGKREIEIAAELERFIRYNGASTCAFDIIVASGLNSSFPHHMSSERKIRNNELVLIDIGVDYMGYKSDLTRIFFLGKMKFLAKNIYNIVIKAQYKAMSIINPNISIDKIDGAARQYIAGEGWGRFFGHNLGHGIGLEVHEAPHISSKEKSLLKEGMIFTVEPAVYLPDKFGIRLEDMVLVTKEGYEVLSGTLDK